MSEVPMAPFAPTILESGSFELAYEVTNFRRHYEYSIRLILPWHVVVADGFVSHLSKLRQRDRYAIQV